MYSARLPEAEELEIEEETGGQWEVARLRGFCGTKFQRIDFLRIDLELFPGDHNLLPKGNE